MNHLFQTTPRVSRRKKMVKSDKNRKKIRGDKIKISVRQVQFEQCCETKILVANSKSSSDVPNVFLVVSEVLPA